MLPPFHRPLIRCIILTSLLIAWGCAKPSAKQSEARPSVVVGTPATKKTVPIQIRAIGSVTVVSTVTIRPRVAGELMEVHFKEGDYVKKGQKLFTIDPRPYESAVAQAEANLAKDRAVQKGAEVALARVQQNRNTGAVAAIEIDVARTALDTSRAIVSASEAALHSAKLQLSFTTIYSPMDGRTGGLLVSAGNLINANDVNPLVVINQVSPIYISFSIPEQLLPNVDAARRTKPVPVEANLRDGESPIVGVLAFVDNAVDTTTGTVQLKAEFKNEDRKLWPGQFVQVTMTIGERPNSIVVPTVAVQSGQQGSYVFCIDDQMKAVMRPVHVAFELEGEAVIESGLKEGDLVVTEGQLRIAPGSKVVVKTNLEDNSTISSEATK